MHTLVATRWPFTGSGRGGAVSESASSPGWPGPAASSSELLVRSSPGSPSLSPRFRRDLGKRTLVDREGKLYKGEILSELREGKRAPGVCFPASLGSGKHFQQVPFKTAVWCPASLFFLLWPGGRTALQSSPVVNNHKLQP